MMKSIEYQTIFVVVLLNFYILEVVCDGDETNEESQPNYEYIQIFKSIPALFEYLLDALEERPEILEKNDVTMFKRNIDGRETDECDYDNEKTIDKREADCDNTDPQNKDGFSKKVYERDTSDSKEKSETTVAYEYGNSNVIMKGLDEIERQKTISKRLSNIDNDDEKITRDLQEKNNRIGRYKRNTLSKLNDDANEIFSKYGEMFFGFEHLFGLDLKPEEIEERILTAEKLLEEHNNKKDKK